MVVFILGFVVQPDIAATAVKIAAEAVAPPPAVTIPSPAA
jgi:hypothetical protein